MRSCRWAWGVSLGFGVCVLCFGWDLARSGIAAPCVSARAGFGPRVSSCVRFDGGWFQGAIATPLTNASSFSRGV